MNILLLGPQGSGKGTQAKRIAGEYGLAHIATGEILRSAIAAETPLGLEVKEIVEGGSLVPDELMINLLRERLDEEDTREGFILDGFPRTMAQAQALDAMLAEIGRTLDAILFFDLPDDIARERMRRRAVEEDRPDDTPEAMERRLDIYHRETEPVVEHYRATGRLVPLHAGRTIS
ncbi:MAG TPA: adenylate kinase, partial [Thermoanaerobaculia bacterium]